MEKIIAESLFERNFFVNKKIKNKIMGLFTQYDDPIKELGLGNAMVIKEINKWLKDIVKEHQYSITKNLYINVYTTIDISEKDIIELPEFINFKYIGGGFYCINTGLISLRGFPRIVTGSFICTDNNLKNLINSPKKIGESLILSNNGLESLEGFPIIVNKNIMLNNNNLENLKNIPNVIYGDFYINNNPLKTLKYFPKKIYGNLYISLNEFISEEKILKICKIYNKIINI